MTYRLRLLASPFKFFGIDFVWVNFLFTGLPLSYAPDFPPKISAHKFVLFSEGWHSLPPLFDVGHSLCFFLDSACLLFLVFSAESESCFVSL